MADATFIVLDAAAATVTFRAQSVVGTTLVMMSVPSNLAGTALIGQAVMASSISVAISSNQSNVPFNLVSFNGTTLTIGQQVVTASIPVALPSNQIVSTNLMQVGAVAFGLGQAIMATSLPVAIASNQSSIPVTITTTVPSLLTVISTAGAPAATDIKTSAGTLKCINMYNNNTSAPIFLKIYNSSAAGVTVASSTAVLKFTAGVVPGDVRDINFGDGAAFTTAMSYAITLGAANTDTAAVSINDLFGVITFI